jgi:two-component system, chemotaxis family, sensor kinase CheA
MNELENIFEQELARLLEALQMADTLPRAMLVLHRAEVASAAVENPLFEFFVALRLGHAQATTPQQQHWLEACRPHALTLRSEHETTLARQALLEATTLEAAALALYRARVAYNSLEHPLAQGLRELSDPMVSSNGESFTSSSNELILSSDGEWSAWKDAVEQMQARFSPELQNLKTLFQGELGQRLSLIRQAPNPIRQHLEVHRLRVAAHALQDPFESDLLRFERGEAVQDPRLQVVQDPRFRAAVQEPPQASPQQLGAASLLRPDASRLDANTSLLGQSINPLLAQGITPLLAQSMVSSGLSRSSDNLLDVAAVRGAAQESVRVPVARLDSLLAQAGELTVGRIRIEERLRDLRELLSRRNLERRNLRHSRSLRRRLQPLAEDNRDIAAMLGLLETSEENTRKALDHLDEVLNRLSTDLAQLRTVNSTIEEEVLSVRLLPAAMLFPPLERLVRDLGQQLGKQVRLLTLGGSVGIDRKILEGLRDPLMHMIRNALDHGLEVPSVRAAAGKPEEGTISLSVSSSGGVVTLLLNDDGAGMDAARILQKAQDKGMIQAGFDPKLALELIFEPGFSTAAAVTDVSGRGVGMDVVRQNIRALGGTVSVQSQLGQGSQFAMRLPAQLATVRVLLVRVGRETFALPTTNIERTGRVKFESIHQLEGRNVVILSGRPVPVVELGAVLDVPFEAGEAWQPYVVLRRDDDRLACTVDAMLGEQEVVVKKLSYPLERFAPLEGAAVLGSGQLVSILSSLHLLERGLKREIRVRRDLKMVPQVAVAVPRIMVVDDSITSRTLERSILEAAGFETITAVHGAQALEFLRRGEHVDLVVSDVEMPELDGFGLTSEIRRDPRLAQIPVILITSLNAPEHKERGAAAGADAYIVKGEFDQGVLLETINRLL